MEGKNAQVTNTVNETLIDNVEVRKVDKTDLLSVEKSKTEQDQHGKLAMFGSYLFSSQNLTFEPKLNIPTPQKYMLGTYDELVIDISGLYEVNYKLKVSPEGIVRIPNVGPIKVAGLSVEDASINLGMYLFIISSCTMAS